MTIKRHPRSTEYTWPIEDVKNISILSKSTTLADAIKNSGMVININSNAVLEAGLCARPVIFFNSKGIEDRFSHESFSIGRVCSEEDLGRRVKYIFENYKFRACSLLFRFLFSFFVSTL